jgi:NitT/TauT family transport system ATP-binding protein
MKGAARVADVAARGASATEVHVEAKGVTRVYAGSGKTSGVQALTATDLRLRRGEFYSIIGPSGCGKSTLLDLVAGLSRPTTGEILFEGRPLDGQVPDGIGVVFQEDASFPWLNVAENIVFGLRRAGTDAAEVARRLDHALKLMGLADFAQAYPAQLSGGMRQRVCIARTLVTQPRLILLDEPFGALDAQTRLIMGDELLKVWRETSATVLLITHALDESAMLSDRIGIMSARPGHIIEEVETGWPRERDSRIAADPAFGDITTRLWSVLREESLKTIRQGAHQ